MEAPDNSNFGPNLARARKMADYKGQMTSILTGGLDSTTPPSQPTGGRRLVPTDNVASNPITPMGTTPSEPPRYGRPSHDSALRSVEERRAEQRQQQARTGPDASHFHSASPLHYGSDSGYNVSTPALAQPVAPLASVDASKKPLEPWERELMAAQRAYELGGKPQDHLAQINAEQMVMKRGNLSSVLPSGNSNPRKILQYGSPAYVKTIEQSETKEKSFYGKRKNIVDVGSGDVASALLGPAGIDVLKVSGIGSNKERSSTKGGSETAAPKTPIDAKGKKVPKAGSRTGSSARDLEDENTPPTLEDLIRAGGAMQEIFQVRLLRMRAAKSLIGKGIPQMITYLQHMNDESLIRDVMPHLCQYPGLSTADVADILEMIGQLLRSKYEDYLITGLDAIPHVMRTWRRDELASSTYKKGSMGEDLNVTANHDRVTHIIHIVNNQVTQIMTSRDGLVATRARRALESMHAP